MTVHGVRIYNEQRVHFSRLNAITHADLVEPPPERRISVGRQIQRAIKELKQEIREARITEQQPNLFFGKDDEREQALESVGALVERFRDDRKGVDLLADDSDFVDFVFRNSTLLKLSWLQVVDAIRYGTPTKAKGKASLVKEPPPPSSASSLSPSAVDFFTKEFGFERQSGNSSSISSSLKPQPARAAAIEKRMTELGFQHALGATSANDTRAASGACQRNRNQRPDTSANEPEQKKQELDTEAIGRVHHTRDDSTLADVGKRVQTSQDLHRLIYELKVNERNVCRSHPSIAFLHTHFFLNTLTDATD